MSEQKEPVNLEISISSRLADGCEEHFVEIIAKIPAFFGDTDMMIAAVPRSLYQIPGVKEILKTTARDVCIAFIKSTGSTVVGSVERDVSIPVDQLPN